MLALPEVEPETREGEGIFGHTAKRGDVIREQKNALSHKIHYTKSDTDYSNLSL